MLMDVINTWGVVVGLIGIVLTVFFYFKSKSRKLLEYQINSTELITKDVANIPNLKVFVGGEPTSDLTSTTVEFTNMGNAPISYSDIASKAPIQITSSGQFFNASDIKSAHFKSDNEYLNQSVEAEDSKIKISFEYLKPKQFFSITVLHSGQISVSGDLITGTFRPHRLQNKDAQRTEFPKTHLFFIFIAFAIAISIMSVRLRESYFELEKRYILQETMYESLDARYKDLLVKHESDEEKISSLQKQYDNLYIKFQSLLPEALGWDN